MIIALVDHYLAILTTKINTCCIAGSKTNSSYGSLKAAPGFSPEVLIVTDYFQVLNYV